MQLFFRADLPFGVVTAGGQCSRYITCTTIIVNIVISSSSLLENMRKLQNKVNKKFSGKKISNLFKCSVTLERILRFEIRIYGRYIFLNNILSKSILLEIFNA